MIYCVNPQSNLEVSDHDETSGNHDVHAYEGFLEGSFGLTLLTEYVDHVAFRLWYGEI